MESFSFFLKNERSRSYDRISIFIVIINIAAFTYLVIATDQQQVRLKSIGGLIFSAAGLIFSYLFKKKHKKPDISFQSFIDFGITMAWIAMEYWVFAGINLILGAFYFVARREKNVTVNKNYILYPSLPAKHIRWEELSKVILKDGLLTIDFKNNKLIQQEVDENKTKVEEKEFNDFCSNQLKVKSKK